jgi:hypothetical protein
MVEMSPIDQVKTREAIHALREQLRLLLVIADGLHRQPVQVATGEHQPRRVVRHVVHAGQTYADALNEFATQLVFPTERYVAHARQLGEYHQVKLRPPLGGEEDENRSPDPDQPDDIRDRSRALYDTSGHEGAVIPLEQPAPLRRATRRPQAADGEE